MSTNDPDFDAIVARMAQTDGAAVEVTEVAEHASMVEVMIRLDAVDHPEVTLFATFAEYLAKTERRAVICMNCVYELRNGNVPHLVATLVLTPPV